MSRTVEEAKQELRDNWENGVNCECCGQFVKLYRRKLSSSMARTLINMYNAKADFNWVHRNSFKAVSNDYSYLRYWGLIQEKKLEYNSEKKNSGYWGITNKGREFVKGNSRVPSHIRLFNQKFYGFEGKEVTITDCLGSKFNYDELLNTKARFNGYKPELEN